jgi:tetratricopeptide (TPR) repeat protein
MTEAENQYKTGLELKAQGEFEKALTAFRRAVISEPRLAEAHLEIGRLCKDKARLDSVFLRHAFDAYRAAARLDLNSTEAHEQYIILAQQMKILDQLHDEYETWSKQHPNNALIQRSYKNLVAISMALFSPQVDVGRAAASGTMKKIIFITSIATLLLGALLIFVPPMFSKAGKVTPENLKSFLMAGIVMCAAGIGGFILHRRLD